MRELIPTAGILFGLILGAALYGVARLFLPDQIAVSAMLIGLSAGACARFSQAIGTPAQLRIIVFGSITAALLGEYAAQVIHAPWMDFEALSDHLVADPSWLGFSVAFLVLGIFLGARILVGGDPLRDLLKYTSATVGGGSGSPCPRCDSTQTRLRRGGLELDCAACGHRFSPPAGKLSPS